MTFCKFCGKDLPEESTFCSQCGKSQTEKPAALAPKTEVGMGTYFGLLLLFMLPMIGVIASLVFSIVAKNPNIKNFARAALVWALIGTLVCLIAVGIGFWIVKDYIFPAEYYWDDPIRHELDPFEAWEDYYFDHPQWEPYF